MTYPTREDAPMPDPKPRVFVSREAEDGKTYLQPVADMAAGTDDELIEGLRSFLRVVGTDDGARVILTPEQTRQLLRRVAPAPLGADPAALSAEQVADLRDRFTEAHGVLRDGSWPQPVVAGPPEPEVGVQLTVKDPSSGSTVTYWPTRASDEQRRNWHPSRLVWAFGRVLLEEALTDWRALEPTDPRPAGQAAAGGAQGLPRE